MFAEMTAQAMAVLVSFRLADDCDDETPTDVVFDNKIAGSVARAECESWEHKYLCTVTAVLWQMVSMRKHVRWYHTYSHCLETLNVLCMHMLGSRGGWSQHMVLQLHR